MTPDNVQRLVEGLSRAGRKRMVVPYPKFHSIFDRSDGLTDRYIALAKAIRLLGESQGVDYGALLAGDNGQPDEEFFQRFRRMRPNEYADAMGVNTIGQSRARRKALVERERARVYEHARSLSVEHRGQSGQP